MTDGWFKPDRVFDGQDIVDDLAVRVADGAIVETSRAPIPATALSGLLTPGFVDLQVNGGGGVLLNNTPTADGMAQIAAAHRRFGTAAILPTVITDHPDVLAQAAAAAIAAKDAPDILGLHIEGPHISVAKRGTHRADCIRPLDQDTLTIVSDLRSAGVAVMITLAPEAATLAQITALSEMGAVVSLGHTDATAEEVEAAIKAGARCGTHLFNAMSPMTSRAPGAVGAILNAGVAFGMICDGAHVDDRMLRLALRACAGGSAPFLVSDAMATVGGETQFTLYGQTIRLQEGRLVNAEGNLAGAHITQAAGMRRLVQHVGIPLADALRMVVTTPATLIGQPRLARVLGRLTDDLFLLDGDGTVVGTLTQGIAEAES
ncbi:N-acetylglucosamine 6-phosphate deacetylase [Loktanella sp. PT4BL]|jgi:N-acetylglucosamine-6-phosphate deacetylase|uniref:N-acetylglucosamine-6-phosphate deacetylase n=1 Tax=Loktanella sp. PT4BL TaxID=2135611 RepID=UPI000D751A6E|nr:N-acetylglucosamine-6-phosphate deacetylase [Loktanella sp. PT4BL]PXW72706.1 N-acetylglucosamine 6-phosphate deacetylase [Loktanella sp. PT4BL]